MVLSLLNRALCAFCGQKVTPTGAGAEGGSIDFA